MDRRTQFKFKSIVLILFILASFTTFSQCIDSIKVVQKDSCTEIVMSTTTFTGLYKIKKNYELLVREVPNIKKMTDSLNKKNEKIEENYQQEIDSTNAKIKVLNTSLEDCYNTLAKVDIENMHLSNRVGKLKKRQVRIFGIGFTVGLAIPVLYKAFSQ